jgi:hypothetical protein
MRHRAYRTAAALVVLALCACTACASNGATPIPTPAASAIPTPAASAVCAPQPTRAPLATCWALVAPLGSGGFPPEPGSNDSPHWEPGRWPMTIWPVVAFNGDLWGWSRTHVWSSRDGLHWAHHAKTPTEEGIFTNHVFFKDRVWMFGGLRYDDRVPHNDIWSSRNGRTWTKAGSAEWSPRKSASVVVFRDKLWLFGGADKVEQDFSTLHMLNDVWTSADGLHWTRVTASAPWSAREESTVVPFENALYVIGGEGRSDVWRSTNGLDWTRLTTRAPWGPRSGYARIAFGGKLWVYGGWRGKTTNALNDIWYSSDGKTWVRQTAHAPWGPRSPRTVIYRDKLWIFSGKHTGGPDNWGGDIWTMSLP